MFWNDAQLKDRTIFLFIIAQRVIEKGEKIHSLQGESLLPSTALSAMHVISFIHSSFISYKRTSLFSKGKDVALEYCN